NQFALTTATTQTDTSGRFGENRAASNCRSSQTLRTLSSIAKSQRTGAVSPIQASSANRATSAMMRAEPRHSRQSSIASSAFQAAESAVAGGIVAQGLAQVGLAEFGPALLRDPELGIADLPEQEVADPHFARRADQKVGVGHPGCIQVPRDFFFAD